MASGRRAGKPTATRSAPEPRTNAAGGVIQRLPPASRAVPVLRLDGEPSSRAAVRRWTRSASADEANHQYDLTDFDSGAGGRQPAAGVVPEGDLGRGRAPRLLRPARRAALRRARAQRAPAARRSGTRPPSSSPTTTPTAGTTTSFLTPQQGSRGPSDALDGSGVVRPGAGQRALPRALRPGPAPAAAAGLAVGEAELHRLARRPSRRRSHASSRTTGTSGASATSRSTRAARRSTTCSTSTGPTRAPKLWLNEATGEVLPGAPAAVAIAPARPDPGPRPVAATPAPTASATATAIPTIVPQPDVDADAEAEAGGQAQLHDGAASASASRCPAGAPVRTRASKARCGSSCAAARRCWRPLAARCPRRSSRW